jgi:hypothetical protein
MSKRSKQSSTNLLLKKNSSKSRSSGEEIELNFDDDQDHLTNINNTTAANNNNNNNNNNSNKNWNNIFNSTAGPNSTVNNNNNNETTNMINPSTSMTANNNSMKINKSNETATFINSNNSQNNNTKNTNENNNPNMTNNNIKIYNHNYRSNIEIYRLKLSKSKLKAVTRTSALLSGFAMVAMVELGLDYSDYFEAFKEAEKFNMQQQQFKYEQSIRNNNLILNRNLSTDASSTRQIVVTNPIYSSSQIDTSKFLIPESILILYALVTCLLVGVHMLALMISTCILPQIEASSFEMFDFEQHLMRNENSYLMNQSNRTHNLNATPGSQHSVGSANLNSRNMLGASASHFDSELMFPYRKFHRFIELAWVSSTVLGIFLFLVEIGLVCYIKFYPISFFAALTGALVMIPICIIFVLFTFTFYKRLADFKVNVTKQFINQVNRIQAPLHDNII